MKIDEAIKIISEKEGASNQRELAKILGVSQGTISNYSQGKVHPTFEVAILIYSRYEIQVEPYSLKSLKEEIEKMGK